MRYPRFEFDALTLYPIVCMHLGAPQCDLKFIEAHVDRIKKDPAANWVYMGDGGECVTKLSKGDIYSQTMSPQEQLDSIVEILEPIRSKGLFGIRGNHGNRIYKETGLEFDKALCVGLGIPYFGSSTFADLVVGDVNYSCYFHHGSDSGTSHAAKVRKAEDFARYINADAIFTAHSHVAMALSPAVLQGIDRSTKSVTSTLRQQYICGCAYDSRTGYAEEKGYPPLIPAWLSVEFNNEVPEQVVKFYRSSAAVPPAVGRRR